MKCWLNNSSFCLFCYLWLKVLCCFECYSLCISCTFYPYFDLSHYEKKGRKEQSFAHCSRRGNRLKISTKVFVHIVVCVVMKLLLISLWLFLKIMLVFLTSGASAAAAIVYLAHNGNTSANWFSICQQYTDFCQRSAGSLIGSFGAMALMVLLIIFSAIALSRR